MGVSGRLHAPAALPPGKGPGTNCIGGCVGLKAGLNGGRKAPALGFYSRTVQPMACLFRTTLRMSGSVPPLPLYAFMAWTERFY